MRDREPSFEPSTAGHGSRSRFLAFGDVSRACDRFFAKRAMIPQANLNYKQVSESKKPVEVPKKQRKPVKARS